MLLFWAFYSSQIPKKIHHDFHKNIKKQIIFNIENNMTCFLSTKSAYSNDFWKIWHFKIDYILQYIKIEKGYFKFISL